MSSRKRKKDKKYSGTELEAGYAKGTDANLFLDRPFMALSNLSKKKNGKEVPVNVQISDYLKSMQLLEISIKNIENVIEESSIILNSTLVSESKTVKGRIKGRTYTTTRRMIEAVKSYDLGRISEKELKDEASWAEDPDAVIAIARIIGRQV